MREIAEPGTNIFNRGWPDFLLERAGKVWAVEVKTGADKLSPIQAAVHDLLNRVGLKTEEVYVQRPGKYTRRQLWNINDDPHSKAYLNSLIRRRTELEAEITEVQKKLSDYVRNNRDS